MKLKVTIEYVYETDRDPKDGERFAAQEHWIKEKTLRYFEYVQKYAEITIQKGWKMRTEPIEDKK